jgi:hypothetical protein
LDTRNDLDKKLAQLSPERRVKVEVRTAELSREHLNDLLLSAQLKIAKELLKRVLPTMNPKLMGDTMRQINAFLRD